jgi:hypothetical protein
MTNEQILNKLAKMSEELAQLAGLLDEEPHPVASEVIDAHCAVEEARKAMYRHIKDDSARFDVVIEPDDPESETVRLASLTAHEIVMLISGMSSSQSERDGMPRHLGRLKVGRERTYGLMKFDGDIRIKRVK